MDDDHDCGCDILPTLIDGLIFPAHHQIPDDGTTHQPTTGCECRPILDRGYPMVVIHRDTEKPPG